VPGVEHETGHRGSDNDRTFDTANTWPPGMSGHRHDGTETTGVTEHDSTEPVLAGVHHLKIPVSDLDTSTAWYGTALRAHRDERFDHRDADGRLFGVILTIPGVDIPVELRLAPESAAATAGHDPITFGVADRAGLDRWVAHLDGNGVEHSPVIAGFIGHLVQFSSPDGLEIRIYTVPPGGLAAAEMADAADVMGPSGG
jgi:catechol 2,3-dioxygenase-like lactoylglutathione lyase family enzyme